MSRLRNKGPPGRRRVRGRGLERFGLANLSPEEMELVDGDTALFLKQVALWKRAEEAREQRTGGVGASRVPAGFLLESPQDPATYLDEPESPCVSLFVL